MRTRQSVGRWLPVLRAWAVAAHRVRWVRQRAHDRLYRWMVAWLELRVWATAQRRRWANFARERRRPRLREACRWRGISSRWETLLSVDDYVGQVVAMLKAAGQLDNTYFLYTSDHGFQLGQHRLPGDKRHLYEHDIRIPMVMRGPGIKAGSKLDKAVLNIDVAPTLVDIMTGSVPDDMDGRSFKSLLLENEGAREPSPLPPTPRPVRHLV